MTQLSNYAHRARGLGRKFLGVATILVLSTVSPAKAEPLDGHPDWNLVKTGSEEEGKATYYLAPADGRPPMPVSESVAERLQNDEVAPESVYKGQPKGGSHSGSSANVSGNGNLVVPDPIYSTLTADERPANYVQPNYASGSSQGGRTASSGGSSSSLGLGSSGSLSGGIGASTGVLPAGSNSFPSAGSSPRAGSPAAGSTANTASVSSPGASAGGGTANGLPTRPSVAAANNSSGSSTTASLPPPVATVNVAANGLQNFQSVDPPRAPASPKTTSTNPKPNNPTPPSQTTHTIAFNFVASDTEHCQSMITDRLDLQVSCAKGLGCAKDGYPPGDNRPSANPDLQGACLVGTVPAKSTDPVRKTYSFTGDSQSDCETQINSKLGFAGTCTPGGSCNHTDGTLYGACIVISFTANTDPIQGVPHACPANANDLAIGTKMYCTCSASSHHSNISGTGIYTSESDICTAARHAWVLDDSEEGNVRLAVTAGISGYVGFKNHGITSSAHNQVDKSFMFPTDGACHPENLNGCSPAFNGPPLFISALYRGLLTRDAEPSGLDFWLKAHDAGRSCYDISKAFLAAAATEKGNRDGAASGDDGARSAYLMQLYRGLLGRPHDNSGFNYWMDQLRKGLTIDKLEENFLESEEFKERCGELGMNGSPPPDPKDRPYNFVAGSIDSCEKLVEQKLGFHFSCSIGGGCAHNGAIPSDGNPSANPKKAGACIEVHVPARDEDKTTHMYGFHGPSKEQCESYIITRFGFAAATCSWEGSCDKKKDEWGACVKASFVGGTATSTNSNTNTGSGTGTSTETKTGTSTATSTEVVGGASLFVNTLYHGLLNRDSDPDGFDYWIHALRTNGTCYTVGRDFLIAGEQKQEPGEHRALARACGIAGAHEGVACPGEQEEWVRQLYRGLLGREAESDGFKYWAGQLENGVSVETVERGILESPEYRARCVGLGIGTLGQNGFADSDKCRENVAAGRAMVAAGIALLSHPETVPIGMAQIAAGNALISACLSQNVQ